MSAAQDSEILIPPGTVVLDKYRVERQLGVGGMGIVVKAIHTALGTPVAIKFLLPQYSVSQEAARRFVREAQAASKMSSEHIVRVFDTGSSHPFGPYIVMEFLEGEDLAKHLRNTGAFSIDASIDFAVQAALALAEAHAMGIVHRDIKPANLFLVPQHDGVPLIKVLDFGISKIIEQSSLEVTKTTAILGSGLYMSPEQMKSSKTVDHRTDVYALGISLFELLTRTQPFTADSFAELAIKVNMEPPTDIRTIRPDVSKELADVIAMAYAKKVDDRYQTVGELAAALAPWANPRTLLNIEALARREMRRSIGSRPRQRLSSAPDRPAGGRALELDPRGSTPSVQPAALPQGIFESQLKIPRPPTLPTPSSVGMDTFGLSKKGVEPLMHTVDQGAVGELDDEPRRVRWIMAIGAGLVAAAALAFYFLVRTPAPADDDPVGIPLRKPTATATSESPPAAASSSPVTESTSPRPPASSETTATESAREIATSSSQATRSSGPGTVAHPSSATSSRPSVGSVAPEPEKTSEKPPEKPPGTPCKIRDLSGELIDCPKTGP